MGKLGKKARKFAKKDLQSVLKQKRKRKALMKKRYATKDKKEARKEQVEKNVELSNRRIPEEEEPQDISLDAIFNEDENDLHGDVSESDGYLSEDSSCLQTADGEDESITDDGKNNDSILLVQNSKILEELAGQKKKLNRLMEKDPKFVKFLEDYKKGLGLFKKEEMFSDEDEENAPSIQSMGEDGSVKDKGKLLTSSAISYWSHLVKEDHNESALTILLNAYRFACHYGTESTGTSDAASSHRIRDSKAFSNILMFMLGEADSIFRGMLKISPSSSKKETVLELKNSSKWKSVKPLVKSYLRSTLFLLNEVTDSDILAFSLTRLRASIIFFAPFPSLLQRLIQISIQLWTTGTKGLSSSSFLIIRDVAVVFNSDCFNTCLVKAYKSYIARCKFVEPVNMEHLEYLKKSFAELCSLDVQKSSNKVLLSIQQLAKIWQQGARSKKKEAIKKICSWEYVSCIDLWVLFISANIRDYNLQDLFYMIIQLINGVACLFPGPKYLPLRVRCIRWLNHLSGCGGIFIPVSSLVLDVLEYKIGKEGKKQGKAINFSSLLKLPNIWLKSRDLQEECIISAIEMLSVHFAQWSYHISFPELATIPLIHLKRFHEVTSVESLRRPVKRLIDQVQLNVEFIQKKRDEVAFSPKDQQLVETFLQFEKCSANAPFTRYYKSVIEKAASRSLNVNDKISSEGKKKSKRVRGGHVKKEVDDASANCTTELVQNGSISVNGGGDARKKKKRRT